MFFKKRVQRDDDRIWVTTEQKWNGIVNEILKERSENVFILVVAHFKRTAAALKKQFQSRGLAFKDYEAAGIQKKTGFRIKSGMTN